MSAAADVHGIMMQASISYRLQHSGVVIDGSSPIDFARYPFVAQIIDERHARTTIIKGAQMGLTIACVMKTLERAKEGNLRGIGYMFPSESEVSDFAKARFGPMMQGNHETWGRYVTDTDSAALKRIGNTMLYFRGVGQKGSSHHRSLSKLKSIPLDVLVLDERDEMDDDRVDEVDHRLDGTEHPERIDLSTPTLPEYGVDLDYRRSNQSVWMWRCDACNGWTCLELTYPECIAEPVNQDPYYLCEKCRKPLERNSGQWVSRVEVTDDHVGYWVSQLSSPTKSATDIVIAAQKAVDTGRRAAFENQTLARAYAEVDQDITEEQLNALLVPDLVRPIRHEGPAAMGVDPGKPHWYEVRIRLTDTDSQVIARGKADSYEDLSRIARNFNVQSGVMDQGYDPSAVAQFVRSHPGWYGCLYVNSKVTTPDWDHRERLVKIGRTRLLDDAHSDILSKRVTHYQQDEFWRTHFVPQMRNLKRATVEDKLGNQSGVWVVTGGQKNDHLRHADAYCGLACSRVGIARNVIRAIQNETGRRPMQPKKRSGMML